MKKVLLVLFLGVGLFSANAQINAITETGETVLLHKDGTWEYLDRVEAEAAAIAVNATPFVKAKDASFLVKSQNVNIGVWINPKKWSFTKGLQSDDAEYDFTKKGDDVYAMLISEKIEIPLETLKDIALENARSVAPDIEVSKEEYRTVNGQKVLCMQMDGTIQGMKISYYGYYFSNENGTIQLLAFTGQNIFKSKLKEIEEFLNGFVVL
ncbi:MAG: hypothetical protein N4A46_04895 [Schleiferiaceae bacterium]|nr:hypothetical protein [Schleiferiaceae bacterium]